MPQLLHDLLETSADRHPTAVAVVDGDRELTYGALNEAANKLARLLSDKGVLPGDRVALYLRKSIEKVVAVYAILKAGAVYVPLDSSAPVTRLGFIAKDCGVEVMVTSARNRKGWAQFLDEGAPLRALVVMDGIDGTEPLSGVEMVDAARADGNDPSDLAVPRIDEDLAYILYTSGSTGLPKGVMLTHRNALGFVEWACEEIGVGPEDRLSSHAPFHFDLSTFDLFAAAAGGARVVLVPKATSVFPVEIAKFIAKHEITVWYSVPSILSLLAQHGNLAVGDLPSLRAVIFAGEVFPSKYLSMIMELVPHATWHNWYGPTETNVCTAYTVAEPPGPADGDIPIGSAIANVETFVLDDTGNRVARGEQGELHVRGVTVMRGYWGDPERTFKRLGPVPGGLGATDVAYATGDLVIELPSGDYRFLGRKDHQIKSRGYRIELGEIETAIRAHPGVREAVVVAIPDDVVSNRIWTYVVADQGIDKAELTAWTGDRVPKYMIPEKWHFTDELRKTSTGKIDRQAVTASALQSVDRN